MFVNLNIRAVSHVINFYFSGALLVSGHALGENHVLNHSKALERVFFIIEAALRWLPGCVSVTDGLRTIAPGNPNF
jgi:hypothetical protein